jgi:hypothetical protein
LENHGQLSSNIFEPLPLAGFCLKELLELKGEDLKVLFEVPTALHPLNRDQIHIDLYSFFPYFEKELKRVNVFRHILWGAYKAKHPEGVM